MADRQFPILYIFILVTLFSQRSLSAFSSNSLNREYGASSVDPALLKNYARAIVPKANPDNESTPSNLPRSENDQTYLQFNSFDDLIDKSKKNNQFYDVSEDDDVQGDVNRTLVEYAGNQKVQKANEAFSFLSESKLLDKLTGEELVELPVGISKTIGANKYTMVIARAKLFPQYTELEVYFGITFSDERQLFFGADNIKYTSEGGFIGEVRLGLFADFALCRESADMAIFLRKFEDIPNGDPVGCYVTVDCDGFVDMRIDASFHLSRKWVLPADGNGNVIPGSERVMADFALTVSDWDDILIEANLPSFVLTKVPQVAFMLSGVVIDLSNKRNANGFIAPPTFDYIDTQGGSIHVGTAMTPESNEVPGESQPDGSVGNNSSGNNTDPTSSNSNTSSASSGAADPTWRGVFIQHARIVFPPEFNGGDDQVRLTAGVENLYVDSRGVTGAFYLENVIPMGTLKADKWDMSLDDITVDIVYNEVVRFSFKGGIILPVIDENTPILYSGNANLKRNHYHFSVLMNQYTSFPLFKAAEVSLHPTSMLSIELKEGKFSATAMLSGSLSASADEGNGTSIELPTVTFRKLLILSKAPYLALSANGGHMTLEEGAKLGNNYVDISNLGLVQIEEGRVMLELQMNVNLMGDDEGGANTGGSFGIKARLEETATSQKWVYDGIKMNTLTIDISIGRHVRINGIIEAFSNEQYGNGFRGTLTGGFIEDGEGYKVALATTVIFGTKNPGGDEEYKYWYFDAFVSSEDWAIPLFAGIELRGFGGGAYHHMRMDGFDESKTGTGELNPSSGLVYVPDINTKFGLKASVAFRAKGGAMKGLVTFEMSFNQNMALQEIMFYGQGEMIADELTKDITGRLDRLQKSLEEAKLIDKNELDANRADKITAVFFFRINFEEGFEFQGSFAAHIDAAGGRLEGTGTVDLLISPITNKWHLYIGGYSNGAVLDFENKSIPPVSATINFGGFSVQANMYFLTGNDIPGAPPISPQAASFFNLPTDSNNRNLLSTGGRSPATGTGFAFGASVYFNIHQTNGDCRKKLFRRDRAPVYVDVEGGVGFDISLLKYAETTSCLISGTSPHGLQGWRAGGRLWAYLNVPRGNWKLLGLCMPIPTFSAGVLLDGDVPRPSYFRAALRLSILKIKINMNANIGEQCGTVVN